jgi:hypothetical protein
MKTIKIITFLIFATTCTGLIAQDSGVNEKYGNTLNLGLGIGYYGYIGQSIPVVMLNYEFDIAKSFTLAPFIGAYTYTKGYYWGDKNNTYKDYYYRETVIPVGMKGTYYFDNLLKASSKWDFYVAGSLGFAITQTTWDSGYYGDKNIYRRANPLYANVHIGSEFHISQKFGIFLDLSSGVSTFGFAFHL